MQEPGPTRRATAIFDLAAMGFVPLAVGVSLVAAIPSPSYGGSGAIAAVFPPWWTAERVFEAAGGAGPLLDAGQASFVMVVGFDDPGVAERLRAAGALFLVDAAAVGCAPPIQREG